MQLPASSIVSIVVCAFPALASFGVLALLGLRREAKLWLVPGWLAAAVLAPVLSTFFAVRMVSRAFQAMAMSGGGIGAVSAGMWEATQPIVFCLYLACALAAATFAMSIRALLNQDEEKSTGSHRAASIVSLTLLLLAAIALISTLGLFQNVTNIILNVIDPHAPQIEGIATVSSLISSRLLLTAGCAIGMTFLLLAGIVVIAILEPKDPPSALLSKLFVFLTLLVLLGAVGAAITFHSSAKRLYDTAITGQLSR